MKKTFGIVIAFMIFLTLAACGNTAGAEEQKAYPDLGTVHSAENQNTAQEPETEELSEVQQDTVQQDIAGQDTEQQSAGQGVKPDESETVSSEEQETEMGTKILVVYFSCTGTTRPLAEYAAEILEADLYEIVPEEPYTEADLAYYTDGRADQEQSDPDCRPAISGGLENMDQYETIVIGYPIWHGQAPRIISTFLESYDFSGKTIVPFCTSHSSGIGSSADNLHALCPDTTIWAEGRRFESGTSKEMIMEWLQNCRELMDGENIFIRNSRLIFPANGIKSISATKVA